MLEKLIEFINKIFHSNQPSRTNVYKPIYQQNWPDRKWAANVFTGLLEKKRTSIVDAFWLLTSSDDRFKLKAIELLNTAIKEVDLIRLDGEFRQRTSFEWTIDWRNKSPNDLIPSICTDEEKITILGLSSFHPNGYFREKAIREFIKYDIKRVFPFLIIRVNDWVPDIRTISKKMLLEKINTQNIHLIIQYLPLLNKLKFATREDHKDIFDKITIVLADEKAHANLRFSLEHANPRIRYLCIEILIQNKNLSRDEVIEILHREKIPFVRYLLITNIIETDAIKNVETVSQILVKEKNAKNKKKLLEYAHATFKENTILLFETYIFDNQKSVRVLSRELLIQYGINDFIDKYRNALQERRNIIGAIGGLSELGDKNDATLLSQFLNYKTIKVIREAIKCIAKLDYNYIESRLNNYLADKRQGISKDVRNILINNISSINNDNIYNLFRTSHFQHVKLNCLKILFSLSKWDSIYYILCTINEKDEETSLLSQKAFLRWQGEYNRSYTTPTSNQITRIKKVLKELNDSVRDIMLFSIKPFQKE